MEILSEKLAKLLTIAADGPLLSLDQILVQSPGMSTWLRLEIAKHNGIAAAQSFPLPSSFIWQLCYLLLEGVPETNPFTKPAMTWKLMAVLPQKINQAQFEPLRHYLGDDSINIDDVRLFQLAVKIADIFDQYLVYRPDWVLGWESNQQPLNLEPQHNWQPELWRALVEYNSQQLSQSHFHRANLHQSLISVLSDPQTDISHLPARLFVFGISSMPPQTLDILHALASRIDVFMLSLSPCRHYWGDIVDPKTRARMALVYQQKKQLPEHWEASLEVGNPLLANNGKMGREMLDLVLSLPPENLQLHDFYQQSTQTCLLSEVQHDILEMETLGQVFSPQPSSYLNVEDRRCLDKNDHSLTIRSCHGPLREVETLHDHLLHMIASDPKLHPKDIVVMLPDVASYAPYIDAVFSARQGDHYLPYAIADRGAVNESPLVASFIHLLNLNSSRFGLTEILSIIEVPAVMTKFDISDDEFQQLKIWLQQAGVRWGRNQQTSQEQGFPAFDKHSWAFGIRRMILGYAMGDDQDLYADQLPLPGIEGHSAQALGKLLNFIEAIDNARLHLRQNVDGVTWANHLIAVVDGFYLAAVNDDKTREDINEIRDAITTFSEEISQSGLDQTLSSKVICQWFTSRLTESRVGQRYLAGSINFCTLMPMRSIPFKLVCLLGMNDGVYPRVQYPMGFDLMAHHPARKGDRSRRLDDRYLFLEALMSARQQLYISYIGHSERDNSERIPSMLVSELLEYCQLCYRPADMTLPAESTNDLQRVNAGHEAAKLLRQRLIKHQPLQPFDAKLYSQETEHHTRSYAGQWCPKPDPFIQHRPFIQQPLANVDTDATKASEQTTHQLELQALIRFYRNPAQYFCQRSLKVELGLELDSYEDEEPFSITNLHRYQLQALMIDSALDNRTGEVDNTLLAKMKADGVLPMAPFDDLLLRQYQRDIAPVIERTQFMRGNDNPDSKPAPIDIELTLYHLNQPFQLTGRIEDLYPKGLINFRPGTSKPKDLLRLYLRHLCLNASGYNRPAYLLDIGHFHALQPITAEAAKKSLQQLCELFFVGQSQPLPFMAKTSWAMISELNNQTQPDVLSAIAALDDIWVDDAGYGDGADPYNARLFSFPQDFIGDGIHDFAALAKTVLDPMIELYHTDKLSKLGVFVKGEQS